MADQLAQAEKLIPCEVRMISGCRDEQTSADGTQCGCVGTVVEMLLVDRSVALQNIM